MSKIECLEINELHSHGALPLCQREAVLGVVDALRLGRTPYELGARKIRSIKGMWRFRIGRKYRLLCWEAEGKQKFELLTRQSLESAIARR